MPRSSNRATASAAARAHPAGVEPRAPGPGADGPDPSRAGGLGYYLRRVGPGLVTGAANDDPGAIGTHAQVGAQFGAASFWLAPYTLPLTAVVLEMCGRIGTVAGRGLVTLLRFHYPRWALWGAVVLFALANVVNLAADLGVMADAVRLLAGGPPRLWLLVLAVGSGLLQVFVPYAPYARVLKVLALALLAYVVSVFLVPQDWGAVLRDTFAPTVRADPAFVTALVAVIGTRLSPYALLWEPAQVVEEEIAEGKARLRQRLGASGREVRALEVDVIAGSVVGNLVTWAILMTAAATLHAREIRPSRRRRRRPRRCAPPRARPRTRCSRSASWPWGCSRCPCWPAAWRTRWARRSAGRAGSGATRRTRSDSTRCSCSPSRPPCCSTSWASSRSARSY